MIYIYIQLYDIIDIHTESHTIIYRIFVSYIYYHIIYYHISDTLHRSSIHAYIQRLFILERLQHGDLARAGGGNLRRWQQW